jgi:hypothetical protein
MPMCHPSIVVSSLLLPNLICESYKGMVAYPFPKLKLSKSMTLHTTQTFFHNSESFNSWDLLLHPYSFSIAFQPLIACLLKTCFEHAKQSFGDFLLPFKHLNQFQCLIQECNNILHESQISHYYTAIPLPFNDTIHWWRCSSTLHFLSLQRPFSYDNIGLVVKSQVVGWWKCVHKNKTRWSFVPPSVPNCVPITVPWLGSPCMSSSFHNSKA